MNEIICPHCKKAFKIDEAGFADIVKQVRDHQFEEELQTQAESGGEGEGERREIGGGEYQKFVARSSCR
jgi:hypothetical protein